MNFSFPCCTSYCSQPIMGKTAKMFSLLLICMEIGSGKAHSACDIRNFSGPTGQISSPNFPGQYANSLDCHNYITVSSGETIIITFLAFNTEENYDWVEIICESGNASRSISHSGAELPPVLTLSSCNRVSVHFRSDGSGTNTGYNLTYNLTTDNVIRGFTTKPSNAFPRSDKHEPLIFNCTTTTEYMPWWIITTQVSHRSRWTLRSQGSEDFRVTNSTCGVTTKASLPYRFKTETLGPGSCNLIVSVPADILYVLAGFVVCTDSTLSSARAILAPINLELRLDTEMNSSAMVSDVVRDEEIGIFCNASFFTISQSYTLVYMDTSFQHVGNPVVRMHILRTYWASERNDTFNTASYVLVKAPKYGVFPPYTCNIVCDFYTNISDLSGDSSLELSFSTDPIKVLYWPTEDNMRIDGDNNGQIRIPALLYCSADAYPPATYTWVDESNGNTVNAPTFVITHSGNYTCIASNIIRGRRYQHSKSISLQALDDKTIQPRMLLILLGVLVLTIIIILAIIVIRLCRQQKRTAGYGKEYELPQRGGESHLYETGFENGIDVGESDYDQLYAPERIPSNMSVIYEEIVDLDKGHELLQSEYSTLYETGFGDYVNVRESEYDKPDVIRRCISAMPPIYDEIEDHDYGHELRQQGECIPYDADKSNAVDIKESDYEYPNPPQRGHSTASAIYDELVFDK